MAGEHCVVAIYRRNSVERLAGALLAGVGALFQWVAGAHICRIHLGVVGDAHTIVAMALWEMARGP